MELYLSRIPLLQALRFFARVSTLIDNFQGSNFFDLQASVVREIGQGYPYARRLIEKLVPPRVFLSSEQMAVLQKFAILYSPESDSAEPDEFGDSLLRVMLSYNDLRGKEVIVGGNPEASLLAAEIRSTFVSDELSGFLLDLYWQFFKWSQTAAARSSRDHLDINADLQQLIGYSYIEYAASAFVYMARSLNVRTIANLSEYDPVFNITLYLQNLTVPDIPRRWLSDNALSIEAARSQFAASSSAKYSGFSLQALMSRPFVLVAEDSALCPHRAFLENKIATGLFFTLLDAYNAADGNRTRSDKLTRFFGDFFETHCVNMAKNTHPTPELVFGEQPYSGGKSTDLVIFEGESAVFIDIATVRLALAKTVIDLDEESIDRDIGKIVDNARQMTTAIAAFRNGRLQYRGADGNPIDPQAIRHIYPVAVIVAPIPRLWQFNKKISDRLSDGNFLPDTEPFEVLSAREFDLLMRLVRGGHQVSEVLERKLHHARPIARQVSFWHYVGTYDHELLEQAKAVEWPGLQESWFDELREVVRSWGLAI